MLVPQINEDNIRVYVSALIVASRIAQLVGVGLETCFPKLEGNEVHFTDLNGIRTRSSALSGEAIQLALYSRKMFRHKS